MLFFASCAVGVGITDNASINVPPSRPFRGWMRPPFVAQVAVGVGSIPSHKASVSVVPLLNFAPGRLDEVAFLAPFASIAVGVGRRPRRASVSSDAFPAPAKFARPSPGSPFCDEP